MSPFAPRKLRLSRSERQQTRMLFSGRSQSIEQTMFPSRRDQAIQPRVSAPQLFRLGPHARGAGMWPSASRRSFSSVATFS